MWKWLAELLGPGGFVAFCAAVVSGFLNWKQLNWSRRDAAAHQCALVALAKELADKAAIEIKDLHNQCRAERNEWAQRLEQSEKDRRSRALQARNDAKGWYTKINTLEGAMKDVNGALKRLSTAVGQRTRRGRG